MEANRDLLVRRLARLGLRDPLQAADGEAALAIIRQTPPDLVLLDIMMPVMDGFEVLQAMQQEGLIGTVPVIVISAMNDIDAIVRAIELGAEDFLPKPFNPTLLRARILPTLEKKRLRDAMEDELARRRAELVEARNLQAALTPPNYEDEAVAIEVLIEPAREMGGDLVDQVRLADGSHLLVVGDVSDKGASAALMMARTHSLVRSLASRPDAAELMADLATAADILNRGLEAGNDSCMFVTMLIGRFDPASGRLDYVRCGHVPPFVQHSDGAVARLEVAGGLPLGVSPVARYIAGHAQLDAGDRLLILSDGVTEAAAPDGQLFGDERVARWMGDNAGPAGLLDAVRAYEAGGAPSDDLAILLLRFKRPRDREQH